MLVQKTVSSRTNFAGRLSRFRMLKKSRADGKGYRTICWHYACCRTKERGRLACLAVLSKGLRDLSAITRSSIHWREQRVIKQALSLPAAPLSAPHPAHLKGGWPAR